MSDFKSLTRLILKFRTQRRWKQFHNPKDSAIALLSEATEVLDEFKFKNDAEIKQHLKTNKEKVADELSDVLFWVLLMAYDFKIDLPKSFKKKLIQNEQKYPVSKARGRHTKYTEL